MKPALAIAWYTLLRVAMLVAVWFLLEWLTPFRGLWAIVAAFLISGGISLLLLNRERDAVSIGVAGFFGRINQRIEESKRAEDFDDDEPQSEQDAEGEQHDGRSL
jgi:hypothetical protein